VLNFVSESSAIRIGSVSLYLSCKADISILDLVQGHGCNSRARSLFLIHSLPGVPVEHLRSV
jgi:hypothetical protein